MTIGSILFSLSPFTVCLSPLYLLPNKHTFCQISTGNWSKITLKEIVKNLFDAKLAPLSFILMWSSSAICHLVCSQCSVLSVYLKCVSRFFQWIRISKKEFVLNLHCKWNFVCGIAENVTEGLRGIDFIKITFIWVVQCIQKRSRCGGWFASLWSAINVSNWS